MQPVPYRYYVKLRHMMVAQLSASLHAGEIDAETWQRDLAEADRWLRARGRDCARIHRTNPDRDVHCFSNAWAS